MRCPKLDAEFAGRFSDDFEIPANGVQKERFGHVTLPAKLSTLSRLEAAIADVPKVCR